MKSFRHKRGHLAGYTMTVAELRAQLANYQDDMPVFAGWEGVNAYVTPGNFSVRQVGKGMEEDECDCLVIYVDTY